MTRRILLPFAAFICVCLATFASTQSSSDQTDDPFAGRVVEIVTIFGAPPTGDTLPRLAFLPTALYHANICYPSATGRNGIHLGGHFDLSIFGPRPAIECIGIDQDAVNIAYALSRAGHVEITGPDTLAVMRGGDEVMTLRLLN